jgi:hypothetical protein
MRWRGIKAGLIGILFCSSIPVGMIKRSARTRRLMERVLVEVSSWAAAKHTVYAISRSL